ncbi:MAG: beta-lactamase family protein [Actinomycetota bacterium]|nr:beta-lactamase family protein [Actinomycetota bacterium]
MIASTRIFVVVALLLALAAFGSDVGPASTTRATAGASTPSSVEPSAPVDSTEPTEQAAAFPVAAFAGISEDPVAEELAAKFQAALEVHDVTGGGGMSATVMTPEGTWSGTTGKADGVRDLQVDDQFAIASITKSVVAAQVMLMVEAGELALDDLAADHLPPDLQFDANDATIRHLLSHRSGIPDYYDLLYESQQTDFQRVWTPTEILELLPTGRTPPGSTFSYAETNYLLLKLVIEHLRGRPLTDVLREGVLAINGLERLVHQPDESPTEPMAMPAGESNAVLEIRGGYLPSLASTTAYNASGAIASDSLSLARWWRALCAGEIISQASLTEISTFEPAAYLGSYGLGVYNPANGYAPGFGHTGQLPGYMSWAACLPEDEAVIVVLTNHEVDDGHLAFSHGLARPLVDALRLG